MFIGTRCSLHTPYACRVLDMGLPLFLEKPVCITRPQYEQLRRAAAGKEKQVVVSFPLRLSSITLEMKRIVDSGVLGRLTTVSYTHLDVYKRQHNGCSPRTYWPYR